MTTATNAPHPHQQEPTMGLLEELADKIGAAEEWNPALERAVEQAVFGSGSMIPPGFMRSFGAAMSLVPNGWEYSLTNYNGYDEATLTNHDLKLTAWSPGTNLPRALTAAALKARHALVRSKGLDA